MSENIKMRAQLINGITEIKVLISHPMETGRKKDEAGTAIPAHFVQLVTIKHNDKIAIEMQWGTGISKNPYLTCYIENAKFGDTISVTWQDNLGEIGNDSVQIIAA